MSKRLFGLMVLCLALGGCASFKSASLIADHQQEVRQLLSKINGTFPLKHQYQVRILPNKQMKKTKGVPAISQLTLIFPEDFVKYVYQKYYADRHKIFTCIMAHEISHTEFGLPSKPPNQHYLTDKAAIQLLGDSEESIQYYYDSLRVMKKYWLASRPVGGHLWNAGWNLGNVALMAYTGQGIFIDWYATDLKKRMKLLRKEYNINHKSSFGDK